MGLITSKPAPAQPEGPPRYWYRDNFFMTTDKSRLDGRLVNAVFASDLMWWNSPLEPAQMSKMLDNCLVLAVYAIDQTEKDMQQNGPPPPHQAKFVGFARLVTDYVTFAYLTDVFVVDEYQRRGLASWMMRAVKEVVDEWPALRGLMLMTHDEAAARMYKATLGAVHFNDGPSAGLTVLEMAGRAEKPIPQ